LEAIYQCVPNFSEGRHPAVVEALAAAIAQTPGVRLIDYSADVDHNRCVMTLLGAAEGVAAAALAAACVAVERIDLRTHSGVHPRTGAVDVLPVVPLRGASREEAVALSRRIGAALATELSLPVYFYEWSALPGRRVALPELRRGGWEAIAGIPLIGDRAPDLGPDRAHPSAGIAIVGARGPLVAYNIWLDTSDVTAAQAIAQRIRRDRTARPELEGVRALGLYLASRNRAQVSLNLTRPEKTPLPVVYAYVQAAAADLGTAAVESEIIGAIPWAALGGLPPEAIRWTAYNPAQILETWLGAEETAQPGG
jgi:glutamate formiminotransferase